MSSSWGRLRQACHSANTRCLCWFNVSSYCATPILRADTNYGHHGDQGPFRLLCELAEVGSRSDKYESGVFLHTDSLMVDLRTFVFLVFLQIFTRG